MQRVTHSSPLNLRDVWCGQWPGDDQWGGQLSGKEDIQLGQLDQHQTYQLPQVQATERLLKAGVGGGGKHDFSVRYWDHRWSSNSYKYRCMHTHTHARTHAHTHTHTHTHTQCTKRSAPLLPTVSSHHRQITELLQMESGWGRELISVSLLGDNTNIPTAEIVTCAHAHAHIHQSSNSRNTVTHMHTHTYTHTHAHIHQSSNSRNTVTHMHMHTYIHTHTHTHWHQSSNSRNTVTHMHTHTYTHTSTHTPTHKQAHTHALHTKISHPLPPPMSHRRLLVNRTTVRNSTKSVKGTGCPNPHLSITNRWCFITSTYVKDPMWLEQWSY